MIIQSDRGAHDGGSRLKSVGDSSNVAHPMGDGHASSSKSSPIVMVLGLSSLMGGYK